MFLRYFCNGPFDPWYHMILLYLLFSGIVIMERYCMQNHDTCRSCQPNRMSENRSMQNRSLGGDCFEDTNVYKHADHLPLTMAYVPMQKFYKTFSLQKSLCCGTLFPELCKPFCGKRGRCR